MKRVSNFSLGRQKEASKRYYEAADAGVETEAELAESEMSLC